MTTTTTTKTPILARILAEGYGPPEGAWHGPDLKAALADVSPELAFWRPAPDRHNIAELALHHAYFIRSVRGDLSGKTPEPFVLEGDGWFDLPDQSRLTWQRIRDVVDTEQRRLADVVGGMEASRAHALNLVLGITCHAVYHAGQVQLLKRLRATAGK
jgi:hypothetical protein